MCRSMSRRPSDRGAERCDHQGHEQQTSAVLIFTCRNLGAFMKPVTCSAMRRSASCLRPSPRCQPDPARDRVVVPFQISCGDCWMCERSLYTQCETTRYAVRAVERIVRLFQAVRPGAVWPGRAPSDPEAQFTHILVPEGPPDDRFIYLSDVLPTAWQAVEYAGVPDGGSLLIWDSDRSATWQVGSPSRNGSTRSSRWI